MNKLTKMTSEQFHDLLKSRKFVSTNNKGQHFTFRFTAVHILRDDKHICDYTIMEKDGNIKMIFQNPVVNIWLGDFNNVMFLIDDKKIMINHDKSTFTGKFDITLNAE